MEKILREIFFGIEIETCFHIVGTKPQHPINLLSCFQKKSENLPDDYQWIYAPDDKPPVYKTWFLMPDSSIECDKDSEIQGIDFFPIEIVTPKLNNTQTFINVWIGFIMTENIIYTVNDSQGLHINMSHPKMNIQNFVNTWIQYENVILQLLSKNRREDIYQFSMPLRYIYDRGEGMEETVRYLKEKNIALGLRGGIKDLRFEVRIHEGTMDIVDIFYWNMFCLSLLASSIVYPIDKIIEKDRGTLVVDMIVLLGDTLLQNYILEKYNKNKDDDWPTVEFNFGKNVELFTPLNKLLKNGYTTVGNLSKKLC